MGEKAKIGTIVSRLPGAKRALAAAVLVLGLLIAAPMRPAGADPLSAPDAAAFRAAFEAVSLSAWDTARQLAARAREPVLVKIILWLDLQREDGSASFGDIASFIVANPDWPNLNILRRQAERVMPATLPAATVAEWFQASPALTVGGVLRHAQALLALGRTAEAQALARERWRDIRLTPDEQQQFQAALGSLLTTADHVARLDLLLWADRDTEARRMQALVDPPHAALAEARLRLSNRANGVDQALAAVPPALRNDEGLLFDRLRWRRRANLIAGAIELLNQQPPHLEHPSEWWTERWLVVRQLIGAGNHAAAYALVSAVPQAEGTPRAESEWLAGWLALRFVHQPARAVQHFRRLYEGVGTPISLARGAYWTGRAEEALGRAAEARRWYGIAAQHRATFYGQIAAGRLSQPTVPALPPDPPASAEARRAFETSELVRAARALTEIGETDRAEIFLRHLARGADTPARAALVGQLAESLGRPYYAVQAAKQMLSAGTTLYQIGYPVRTVPATEDSPERALVLAIIRRESEFLETATSSAGARGLMQLMPGTASNVAQRLGIPHSPDQLTGDPEHNIRLGSNYLAQMLDRFGGSYVLAIAAYNAGPARVDQWLERLGDPRRPGVDVIDWIESIPFYETQNYVQRVLEDVQVYRVRLGAAPAAGTLERDLGR